MKTRFTPLPAAVEETAAAPVRTLLTIDQRVHFVNTNTRQRESMPLTAALLTAVSYFTARTPFTLIDLDDEVLAIFDGTQLDARQPLADMLLLTHELVTKVVRRAIVASLEQLQDEAQRMGVLNPEGAQSTESASTTEPESLGPFE